MIEQDDVDMSHPDYELVKHLGSGSFGEAKLMRYKPNGELVAVKFIEKGYKIDKKVEREIVNHRALLHPNVIRFNEVFLTSSHLAIAMEYAPGGELFDRIADKGRFSEDVARYFFQQLVAGVTHCHSQGICHRDLKLENVLLDNRPAPRLKICDFGYSKSFYFDSQPKSTVGTTHYLAPELLTQRNAYDGQLADVWSCGVTLFVMLVGHYPFEDLTDPSLRKSIERIRSATYTIPKELRLTYACRDLVSRMFVADPSQRITIEGIQRHPWFLKNLSSDLLDGASAVRDRVQPRQQSMDAVRAVIREAQLVPATDA